jgi:hypothetical protein
MSGSTLTFIIVAGVVVIAAFLLVWRLDARRATQVEQDEERLDVDPDMPTEPVDRPHSD